MTSRNFDENPNIFSRAFSAIYVYTVYFFAHFFLLVHTRNSSVGRFHFLPIQLSEIRDNGVLKNGINTILNH